METAYAFIAILFAGLALVAAAGFKARRRRTSERDSALLADALEVERQAKALLYDAGKELALHDANAPYDLKEIGYGKALLAARVAASQARWARRQLEYGEDFAGASVRLGLARGALTLAGEKASLGKVMLVSQDEDPEVASWRSGPVPTADPRQ